MASINFRTKGSNKPEASIYVTFRNGRDCILEMKSGITAPMSDWITGGKVVVKRNDPHHYIKQNLQASLDGLRSKISDEINKTTDYTKEWLEGCVNEYHGIKPKTNDLLLDYFDKYVNYISNQVANIRSQNTTKTYVTSRSRIEEFQNYKGREYRVQDVDITLKGQFIEWARNIAKYRPATYMKTVKQIKTVLKYAKRNGIDVDETYLQDTESMEIQKRKITGVSIVFLSVEEIAHLMRYEGLDHLVNARDWLVISCWTGCRVSDLMKLTSANIHTTISGEKAIKYTQQKTGDKITAPYHPHVAQIIERNGGNFPRPITPQRYNDYIKEVCRLVGMKDQIEGEKHNPEINRKERGIFPKYELVTSHIGRRSFASNHYGQLPTEVVMLVTGHDTVRQFLDYVGKDPEEHIVLMHKFYNQPEIAFNVSRTS